MNQKTKAIAEELNEAFKNANLTKNQTTIVGMADNSIIVYVERGDKYTVEQIIQKNTSWNEAKIEIKVLDGKIKPL